MMFDDFDPMTVPYMKQAFGGGQLTERDMKSLAMSGMLGGGGFGSMLGGRGMGLGSAQPAPIMQAPAPIMHGSSGKGPNQEVLGALLGKPSTQAANGDWIMGSGGFPAESGLGNLPGAGAAQMVAGK